MKTINLPLDKARLIERELIESKAGYFSEKKVAKNGKLSYAFKCANPPESVKTYFCLTE